MSLVLEHGCSLTHFPSAGSFLAALGILAWEHKPGMVRVPCITYVIYATLHLGAAGVIELLSNINHTNKQSF